MFDLLLRRRLGSEKSLRELKRTIFAAKELPIERIQTDTHIYSLRNRKRFPCFYRVIQTQGKHQKLQEKKYSQVLLITQ